MHTTNSSDARMRLRTDVCRAILLTSLVWAILDVVVIFYYLDSGSVVERQAYARNPKFIEPLLKNTTTKPIAQVLQPVEDAQLTALLKDLQFDPHGTGDQGAGIVIPPEREEEMKEKFKINQFNLLASDLVSINRSLPDYRYASCRDDPQLDAARLAGVKTSIIIVFHNEAWSTLLRTLHSIVNRSPLELLEEIILVDDMSERDYLKHPLELYIKRFSIPIHLVHLTARSGLIRARLTGSEMAKGKVLLFLDAHVEVTIGWLEPMLSRIALDRKTVVAPIIDVISDDNFEYVTASDTTWGGFNWHLNFRWYTVPEREIQRRNNDRSTPIRTPTIAGGLFAIDRQFFYDIGSYDEGMEIWGSENIEMSFRVWMCGGFLEIHPCSRVGHVFRKQTPYSFPGGTAKVIYHNAARTANVWMDDYKKFFFSMVPGARDVDPGDITARQKLRKELQCKSFQWYLENIYPESPIPARYRSVGQVLNEGSKLCLDTMGKKTGQSPGLSACHGLGGNQVWSLTTAGEIRSDELCLSVRGMPLKYTVRMEKCLLSKISQWHRFEYDENTKQVRSSKFDLCVVVENGALELSNCDNLTPASQWSFEKNNEL
ncbi:Polypeptide N-acetylgalactosaminyltransferase [Aphelenchoides besseyi]|nr:Polypeptide N-acetylgalactosaminyltransferase [Aphelenchoides besseyi]